MYSSFFLPPSLFPSASSSTFISEITLSLLRLCVWGSGGSVSWEVRWLVGLLGWGGLSYLSILPSPAMGSQLLMKSQSVLPRAAPLSCVFSFTSLGSGESGWGGKGREGKGREGKGREGKGRGALLLIYFYFFFNLESPFWCACLSLKNHRSRAKI